MDYISYIFKGSYRKGYRNGKKTVLAWGMECWNLALKKWVTNAENPDMDAAIKEYKATIKEKVPRSTRIKGYENTIKAAHERKLSAANDRDKLLSKYEEELRLCKEKVDEKSCAWRSDAKSKNLSNEEKIAGIKSEIEDSKVLLGQIVTSIEALKAEAHRCKQMVRSGAAFVCSQSETISGLKNGIERRLEDRRSHSKFYVTTLIYAFILLLVFIADFGVASYTTYLANRGPGEDEATVLVIVGMLAIFLVAAGIIHVILSALEKGADSSVPWQRVTSVMLNKMLLVLFVFFSVSVVLLFAAQLAGMEYLLWFIEVESEGSLMFLRISMTYSFAYIVGAYILPSYLSKIDSFFDPLVALFTCNIHNKRDLRKVNILEAMCENERRDYDENIDQALQKCDAQLEERMHDRDKEQSNLDALKAALKCLAEGGMVDDSEVVKKISDALEECEENYKNDEAKAQAIYDQQIHHNDGIIRAVLNTSQWINYWDGVEEALVSELAKLKSQKGKKR